MTAGGNRRKPKGEAAIAEILDGAEVVDLTPRDHSDDLERELSFFPKNDYGNGQRILRRYGQDLLYVQNMGWSVWDGKRYAREAGPNLAHIKAQQTALRIRFEVKAIKDAGPIIDKEATKEEGKKVFSESKESHIQRVMDHRDFGVMSGNTGRLRNMLTEAAPHRLVLPDQLDTGLRLFNVDNGTLEIRSRAQGGIIKRRANRKDLNTCVSPVGYYPKEKAPLFDAFLKSMVPDDALRAFLKRWFGYCLTGETGEQSLCLFYGEGANGKGTIVNLVSYIMGDYGKTIDFSSLAKDDRKRGGEARPDIARLVGARFVSSGEPEHGTTFSEGLIKSMTGEDLLTCRKLQQDQFEFRPRFKITLSANLLPTIVGQDEGIWRRFMLVPFEQTVSEDDKDRDLPRKLKAEASGVLNWMLEGAMDWLEQGLKPPEAVLAATKLYREDSDPLGGFLVSFTVKENGASTGSGEIYGVYVKYCEENGYNPKNKTAFGKYMTAKGYKKSKSGIVYYTNLKLLPEAHSIGQSTAPDYPEEHNS